jgi:hypothetical protein
MQIPKNKISLLLNIGYFDNNKYINILKANNYLKGSIKDSFYKNAIKNFSRNSSQWLNRHTNDIYVKKSVDVNLIYYI